MPAGGEVLRAADQGKDYGKIVGNKAETSEKNLKLN